MDANRSNHPRPPLHHHHHRAHRSCQPGRPTGSDRNILHGSPSRTPEQVRFVWEVDGGSTRTESVITHSARYRAGSGSGSGSIVVVVVPVRRCGCSPSCWDGHCQPAGTVVGRRVLFCVSSHANNCVQAGCYPARPGAPAPRRPALDVFGIELSQAPFIKGASWGSVVPGGPGPRGPGAGEALKR